jgi:hypothetical protein
MYDPDDCEQLDEFHRELAEFKAASLVVENASREELVKIVEHQFGFLRNLREMLASYAMVLARIPTAEMAIGIAKHLNGAVESIREIESAVGLTEEEDE